jgi:ABC-type nickel/cobalt efflux system permease component RcnA
MLLLLLLGPVALPFLSSLAGPAKTDVILGPGKTDRPRPPPHEEPHMDHKEQHHQHHQKEREEHKRHAHQHEMEEMRQPRTIHPLWFLVLGIVLVAGAILAWSMAY